MPNKHANPMLGWHPPAELSAWARAEAARRGEAEGRNVPYGEILTEALAEKRERTEAAVFAKPG
jgi:hypothetical protein